MSNDNSSSGTNWGAIISGGASLLGSMGGIFGGRDNRRLVRQQNDKMIKNQWDMWNATNEYNTPLNQRLRMEAGGFNPNAGAGSMQNTAQNQNMPDGEAPLHDTSSYTQAGQAIGETFQNALNNEAMRTKAYADADRADAGTDLTKEQTDQLRASRGTNIALRQQQLDSQILDNFKKELFNSQMPAIHQQRLAESAQRIANMRQVLNNDQIRGMLLKEEHELRKMGINPNQDGFFIRVLAQLLGADKIEGFFNDFTN